MSDQHTLAAATESTGSPRKRSWRRRATIATLAIGGCVGIGAAGMAVSGGGPDDSSRRASPTGRLDLYEVGRADFDINTIATGELRARNQVEVRSTVEQESTITEIIPEGTFVKKGDLLVRLNAESTQQRLDEESLELENARAAVVAANEAYEIQLSENDSARRAAELKLALAQLTLEQWMQGDFESKRQELRRGVETAEKDFERLGDKLQQSEALYQAGYYSKDQLQQDELEFERAEAALEKAILAHDIYYEYEYPKEKRQKSSDVEEAEAEVERVLRQNASRLVSKEADKRNRAKALEIREQKYEKLRQQLEAATIRAPSDGLVVYATSLEQSRWGDDSGPLQVGSKVWPQMTLIVLPDTTEMLASVKVHESLAGRIQKGMPCTIKIDALGDRRFTGRVDSVGILAEQTSRWMDPTLREYSVKIAIDTPASQDGASALRPSMRCEAEITLGRVAEALTIPIQAVHSEGLLRFVYMPAESGKYKRRPVRVGQRSDRFAEIRVGVNSGDRVLLRKPATTELVARGGNTWDPAELAAVGLEINASGDIVPTGGPGNFAGGGDGPRGSRGRGPRARPAGDAPVAAGGSGEGATPQTTPADQPAAPDGAEPASDAANGNADAAAK